MSHMVYVNVYKDGRLVDSLELPGEFLVSEDLKGDVFWGVPEDPREEIRKRLQGWKPRGGSLLLWCSGGENEKYIEMLPSIWDLWISEKRCQKGPYRRLALKWLKVDLVYKSHRFEFLSPKFENSEDVELPRPYKSRPDDDRTG